MNVLTTSRIGETHALNSRRRRPSILRWLTGFTAFTAAATSGGCVFHMNDSTPFEARQSESLSEPSPVTRLVVHNRVGDVTIMADPAAIGVTAEAVKIGRGRTDELAGRALGEIFVSLQRRPGSSDVLDAIADHPDSRRGRAYAVDWKITAPPGMAVDVEVEVGEARVEGFDGPADLTTGVGDALALGIGRGVNVKTGVGDATVQASGPIDVKTEVGDVDVALLAGESGTITITTGVGTVELRLPPDFDGTITAAADVGTISSTLSGSDTRAKRNPPEDQLRTTIGTGSGRTATINSGVGDVRLRSTSGGEKRSRATGASSAPSL